MIELTKENHFKFGRLADEPNTFMVCTGTLTRPVGTPREEAIIAAGQIGLASGDLKIKLCLSGGIDSECMLEAFLLAGIDFEVAILRFKNSLNAFDIQISIDLCQKKNLPFKFIDLDIIHFFDSGQYLEIAKKYDCQSPQIAVHLWFLDQIDGYPVLGGNPVAPIWKDDQWFFVGLPGELHSIYFKYHLLLDRPGVPMFFLYSPELIASFIRLPCMEPYRHQQKTSLAEYTYLEKCRSYAEGGFLAKPREAKWTGFEKVRDIYDQKYNQKYGTAFDDYFRRPLEKLFPFPEKYIQLVPSNYLNY